MRKSIDRCILSALFLMSVPVLAADAPPNLIVIMTDDQGYHDVGFTGGKGIPTPHIDSIAKNGVHFTSGYVTYSVCSPSRAGFITGRYQQRFGYERNPLFRTNDPNMGLPDSEDTMAEVLGKVGYHSGVIGKWHLGAHASHHPLNKGFNEFFGHLGGGHRYFPEELTIKDNSKAKNESDSYRTWIRRNHQPVRTTKYLTEEFTDEAVSFVERNKAKPFFLYLAYNAPHAPLQATEKYLSRFKHIKNKRRQTCCAMVSAVDDGVGKLLTKLREHQLEEKTIIVFLSDNGGPESSNASWNGPLRGGKSDPWEGGIRVPFAMQWKGQIDAGTTYHDPVISLDIFAMIASLSKASISPDRPLDGVNLLPYIKGEKKGAPHRAIYLRKFDQKVFAVRSGNFKLVIPKLKNGPQTPVMFDLSKDLGETNSILSENPEKYAELEKLRHEWNKQLMDPIFKGLIHRPRKKQK